MVNVCDKCRKGEVEYSIDGWISKGEHKWGNDLCKNCYNKIRKLIANFKTSPKGDHSPKARGV